MTLAAMWVHRQLKTPLQGWGSHTVRQSVTVVIITIAVPSLFILIKKQASIFLIMVPILPPHRGSFYLTAGVKLPMRISSRETLFSTVLQGMEGIRTFPMWRSTPGTGTWWTHLPQRAVWCSARSILWVRSSCAADRHGCRDGKGRYMGVR